jgi:hypothetical protein
MKIINWQIDVSYFLSQDIYKYFTNETVQNIKLLNTEQEKFNLLEKYVYDIALFHFNRLCIEYNPNIHFIEFWCKNTVELNNFHFDCDEYEKKTDNKFIYPLLSNIIYLSDSIYPTVITDINLEKYKYKEFQNEQNITLVFPRKNKHITFDGSKRHGVTSIFEEDNNEPRYIIAINLWDRKPTNIEYYQCFQIDKPYNKTQIVSIKPCDEPENIVIVKDKINYDFFENLFYKNKNSCSIFSELIKTDFYVNKKYIFKIENETSEKIDIETTKYTKLLYDIENIKTIDNIVSNNRFLQRFILNNIYSQDTCNWIVNESELYAKENGGWTTNRHNNYPTTDIPVNNIKPIFKYVLGSLKNIIDKIFGFYGIPSNISMDIVDLFIVKYEEGAQNKLDIHTDGSFLTFSIMLSSSKDYEGGGTEFIDGIQMFLEQGDILVHSGYVKHSGLEVTKGTRYILVGFTNIMINDKL